MKLITICLLAMLLIAGCSGDGGEEGFGGNSVNTNPVTTPEPNPSVSPSPNLNGLPLIGFASQGSGGSENWQGDWYAKISLDKFTDKYVTVEYTISGTAIEGIDFEILSPKVLPIDPDQQEKSVWLIWRVLHDTKQEEDETIIFTLKNPTNSTIGEYKIFTHTIIDDDNPFPPQ